MLDKLALGTAQFGLDYGINNKVGQVPKAEAFRILDLCVSCGIDVVDTAAGYGDSELVLGEYIRQKNFKLKIVSKFPTSYEGDPLAVIRKTFDNTCSDKLYGYLFHDVRTFKENRDLWELFSEIKFEGKIKKIGFSLYYPDDLRKILDEGVEFDILQIPYNIFDRRFEPYFDELKNKDIEIHVRSVFLQGIVFKDPSELKGNLKGMIKKLEHLRSLADSRREAIAGICFSLVSSNELIDRIVVGVDSLANLKELITIASQGTFCDPAELKYFIESDEDMILPFNWRK